MVHHEPHITADQLGTIAAPTLIVGGEHDIMPAAHLRWIVDAIPGAQVRITQGTTHMQPMDDPDQVDDAMLGWLDSHPL
jgi:pimeloyl-ACP methyl ester carboxylesterase